MDIRFWVHNPIVVE